MRLLEMKYNIIQPVLRCFYKFQKQIYSFDRKKKVSQKNKTISRNRKFLEMSRNRVKNHVFIAMLL